MLPVARCQTHVAFTSGQAGVELSFKKIVRWSPEVETDARRNVGERLLDSRDRPLAAYWYLTHTTSGILVRKMLA